METRRFVSRESSARMYEWCFLVIILGAGLTPFNVLGNEYDDYASEMPREGPCQYRS